MSECFDYDFYHEVNNTTENSNENKSNSVSEIDLDLDVSLDVSFNEKSETESKEKVSKYYEFYNQKLIDRINDHLSFTSNYRKRPDHKFNEITKKLDIFPVANPTGKMLRLNEIKYLAVIDIDINHNKNDLMDDHEAEITRNQIIDKCKSNNYVLGQSPSGGFHIYCNCDDDWIDFSKNLSNSKDVCRVTGIKIKKGLVLDLFTSMEEYNNKGQLKVNPVLMIGSKIVPEEERKKDENGKDIEIIQSNDPRIRQSKFINGSYEYVINYSIDDVLKAFDWFSFVENHRKSSSKTILITNNNPSNSKVNTRDFSDTPIDSYKYEHFDLPEETQLALINGLFGFDVHRWTNEGDTIKDEVSLSPLFKSLNDLNENLIESAYDQVKYNCKVSPKATRDWNLFKAKYKDQKMDFRVLINIVKNWNRVYYNESVAPLICGIHINKFDLNDKFRLKDLCEKALNHKYRTLEHAANDISKIYRFKHEGDKYLIEKGIDPETQTLKFNYLTFKVAKEELSTIKLFAKTDNTDYTAWDAFLKYKHLFNFDKIVFNQLEDPKPDRNGYVPTVISFFHGYRYQKLPECNMKVIENYLKLIYECISDSRDDVYNYILDWIANIAQNPGKRNMSAIVMKGTQGAGKNTFTDILSQLFVGYSEPNISSIDDIVGRWNSVIENKVLLVMNELMTAKDSYVQSMETLKTLITDPTMRIEEKFQPKRLSENVSNLIFISNNSKPIIIPKNDRRYLVITVNGKFVKDKRFFTSLHNLPESFYDNLMTFFLNRDISQFDPTNVPWTQEKDELSDACRSDVEDFIVEIYDKLTTGILYKDLVECYNKFVHYEEDPKKFKRFKLEIKDKCINGGKFKTSKPFIDGKRREVYKLKPEYEDIYKPEAVDEEISEDPQNYL